METEKRQPEPEFPEFSDEEIWECCTCDRIEDCLYLQTELCKADAGSRPDADSEADELRTGTE